VDAALAQADFEAISKSAEKLNTLSVLEGFVRRATLGYRTQLRSFEFAVTEIQRQAKRKNIEGVALVRRAELERDVLGTDPFELGFKASADLARVIDLVKVAQAAKHRLGRSGRA